MKKINIIAALACALLFSACKKDKPGTFNLVDGSVASWKGFLETDYFNSGTIKLEGGGFTVLNENITGGEIKIPVSSILITNELTTDEKIQLTHHLQSDDFFKMATNPNVIYTVRTAEKLAVADSQGNNYMVHGVMTLLGKSLPLDIPAKVDISATALHIISNFKFDRTKWGMTFATDANPAPPQLGNIKKEISVAIDLQAAAQ